jgi:hypothetical protein
MEFLQRSIDRTELELLKLKQSIEKPSSIEFPSIEPITEALTDEGTGLAAIHGQATAAATNSKDMIDAIGTKFDDANADTVFGRIAGVQATVTDTTSGLPKILEHAGNAANKSEDACTALTTIGEAIGSEGDTAATAENTGSLHAKVRRLQGTVAGLQQLIGTPVVYPCHIPPTLFGAILETRTTFLNTSRLYAARILEAVEPAGELPPEPGTAQYEPTPEPYLCPTCQRIAAQLVRDTVSALGLPQPYADWLANNVHNTSCVAGLAEACPYGSAHIESGESDPGTPSYASTGLYVDVSDCPPDEAMTAVAITQEGSSIGPMIVYTQDRALAATPLEGSCLDWILQVADLAMTRTNARIEIAIIATDADYFHTTSSGAAGNHHWFAYTPNAPYPQYNYGAESTFKLASGVIETLQAAKAKTRYGYYNKPTAYVSYTRPPLV